MERDKLDKFESWLAGELLLASLLGAATALFLTNPSLRSAYVAPQGRLVLDTTVVLAGTIVAILFGVRFAVEARRLDLLLAAGFSVTAAGTLLFAIVPLVSGGPLQADEAWTALCSRILGAALIAVAPFVRGRSRVRGRGIWLTFGLLASALTGIWLLFQPVRDALPSLQSGNERPIMLTVALAALALFALVTLLGFGVRFRVHGEDMDSWLALAATLTVFAELHNELNPVFSSDVVSQGDFLRLLGYGVLLVGVWRAIRSAESGRAVAEERARVASEIHDGLAQYLFALSTHASMLESGARLEDVLPKLKEAAAAAQQEARFAVLALSSASGNAPFDAALRRYVEFLTADGALEVDVEVDDGVQLAPDEQIEVFRIVQEGLGNVRKHAGARSAEVWIGERGGRRVVSVTDDGIGFGGEHAGAGQGLKNMRRRAESISGGFSLTSRPGRGTALEVVLRA